MKKDLKICPQLLVNVPGADKVKTMENKELLELSDKVNEELGKTGRLLLRSSGTENLIRVMVEAESDELCRKYVDIVVEKVKTVQ